MPAVFGKIGRTFPARGNGAPRPAPNRLAEKVPLQPGGGVTALRDWLVQAQRDLPEWDELRTDAQRFAALEKMFADDAVKAAFLTKLFNVSSLDWNVTPALPDDPRSRQTADFHLFNLQGARGGTRGIVEEILLPGLVRGNSVCEMVARPEPEPDGPWRGKRCLAELKAKPHVTVEEDEFGNPTAIVAQTKDGPQKYDPADGFVLFKFLPLFGKPTSDFRAAYRAYRAKAMVVTLWLIGLEKFGQPFFKGRYPAGDTTGLRAQLETALEQVRSRTFVSLPDGTDVEPVQILSGNHAYYQQALDSCDRAIFVAIAGAFLQNITSANRGGPDQRGDSQVQQTTSELFVWHLASCVADTCNDQIIPYWHRLNFAGGGLPKAALGGVNDADLQPGADLDKTLTEIGLPLSKKDAYLRYDRVPPSGPDDVLGGGGAPPPGPVPPTAPAPFAEPETAAAPPLPPGLDVGPLMTVREVCRTLRVSRGKVKTLTDAGELRYKRFGTTIRVPQRAVAEYLTRCEGAPAGGGAAVPFSDAAEFCGGKGGKPGPCPEGKADAPAAAKTARPPKLAAAKKKFVGKTVGAAEHAAADATSVGLAKSLGGRTEEETATPGQKDKKPYDVQVPRPGGGFNDVEVKTLLKGDKQAISVHEDALLRKVNHAAANPENVFHTVVRDKRDTFGGGEFAASYSGHGLYYKRGSGRYSLSQMYPVKDEAELKQLLDTPDAQLPEAARGTLPPPPPLAQLEQTAAKAHESRKARDTARKARNKGKLRQQAAARRAAAKAPGGPS